MTKKDTQFRLYNRIQCFVVLSDVTWADGIPPSQCSFFDSSLHHCFAFLATSVVSLELCVSLGWKHTLISSPSYSPLVFSHICFTYTVTCEAWAESDAGMNWPITLVHMTPFQQCSISYINKNKPIGREGRAQGGRGRREDK